MFQYTQGKIKMVNDTEKYSKEILRKTQERIETDIKAGIYIDE